MDNKKLEKLRQKSDTQIFLITAIVPGAILVATWILWIVAQFFGIDLVSLIKNRSNTKTIVSPQFYLIFAAAATVICGVWSWFNFRKQRNLIRHGILVDGVLTKIGIGASGFRNCRYEFEFNGKKYSHNLSLLEDTAEEIGVGGRLPILVDPARPQSSTPLADL